jgi:hypothetical protein
MTSPAIGINVKHKCINHRRHRVTRKEYKLENPSPVIHFSIHFKDGAEQSRTSPRNRGAGPFPYYKALISSHAAQIF